MKLGIVGLPNVGKSTLFNALTSTQNAQAANYPFCTIEPNSGIVPVPDPRLDKLAEIWQTDKKTPAIVEFVDIAGLVKGASQGAGLGNKFLGHIRECDAIVHVVRCFDDDNIIHVVEDVNKPESVDPIRDIDAIDLELILADLEVVSNRLGRQQKAAKTGNKAAAAEAAWLADLAAWLEGGKPARSWACCPPSPSSTPATSVRTTCWAGWTRTRTSRSLPPAPRRKTPRPSPSAPRPRRTLPVPRRRKKLRSCRKWASSPPVWTSSSRPATSCWASSAS